MPMWPVSDTVELGIKPDARQECRFVDPSRHHGGSVAGWGGETLPSSGEH